MHLDTKSGQLVQDQNLVGVDPGQPVRRQAPDGLEEPASAASRNASRPGRSSRAPEYPSSMNSLINWCPAVLTWSAQRELGADRAAFGLPLGRHPGVDRDPHYAPPSCTTQNGGTGTTAAVSRRNW